MGRTADCSTLPPVVTARGRCAEKRGGWKERCADESAVLKGVDLGWLARLTDWFECLVPRSRGEPGGNRTPNPQIKSLLLCQLSYRPARGNCIPEEWCWCARQDSNLWPSASEADALSS